MSPQTKRKLMEAIKRAIRELAIPEYEAALKQTPLAFMHLVVCRIPGALELFPGISDPEVFAKRVEDFSSFEKLEAYLDAEKEPSPELLRDALAFYVSLASRVKIGVERASAEIRPVGGGPQKLSDPVAISDMADKVWALRDGGKRDLITAQQKFVDQWNREVEGRSGMKSEKISLKTVRRRYSEEIARRKWVAKYEEDAKKSN
jgi:hypothetical protein